MPRSSRHRRRHSIRHPPRDRTAQANPTPPTIAITSPLNGAAFTARVSLALRADVVDTGGIVARVSFWRSFSVGSNSWTSALHGTDAGAGTTSAPVTVTVRRR